MTRKTFILAAAVLTVTLFLAPLALGAPTPKPPPPDYYPLAPGSWWKYQSTTEDGKKSEFTVRVLASEPAADGTALFKVAIETPWQTIHEYYSKPQGWVLEHKQVYTSNGLEGIFKPVKQFLRNPLVVGATWSWTGTGMMDTEISEDNRVSASEAVTVPAGSFTALQVVTDVRQGGQQVKKTYWYANHVGMVKSHIENSSVKSTTVLLDYSFRRRP